MASLPTRTTASFAAIAPVPNLTVLDNEFNQYVGASGIFNGGTTGTKLLVKTSDASDPPIEQDQVGAGPLAEWKQNSTLKVSINNTGQVVSAVATGSSPLTVASTTVVTNLNADLVDGIHGTAFAQTATALIPWTASWLVLDPSVATVGAEEYVSVLVPPLSVDFTIIGLNVEFRAGSHTGGTSITFKVQQRGSVNQDLGTIQLNDTNNTAFTLYGADINPDVVLAASDRLIFTISARSGTIAERNVTVFASGHRKLS